MCKPMLLRLSRPPRKNRPVHAASGVMTRTTRELPRKTIRGLHTTVLEMHWLGSHQRQFQRLISGFDAQVELL